jgi:3-carboxy-cis,cis-muconate cycloisomerase
MSQAKHSAGDRIALSVALQSRLLHRAPLPPRLARAGHFRFAGLPSFRREASLDRNTRPGPPRRLMPVAPYDSAVTRGLFGDPEVASLFAEAAQVRAMLLAEGALATAEARLGIIPADSAAAIDRAARETLIDPATLTGPTAAAGVPVPALVAALRKAVGDPGHARFVHWGASSQDIVDTGLALRLRRALDLLDARLAELIEALVAQAGRHRASVMAARTRSQFATPTTLGARIAAWTMPLIRHRHRLAELRPRVLCVSLGGAAGTNAALAGRGAEVMRGMAAALDLAPADLPPHAARDGIAETGAWLALLTGSLGKIGADLILLGRSEIGEVSAGCGGTSSTMPQKANPVSAEALVTLARHNAAAAAPLFEAMLAAEERDGAAWSLEWFALPAMCVAAAASLRHAQGLAGTLTAHPERMAANIAADRGLMLAEAAVFALAERMPRPAAEKLVKDAVDAVRAGDRTLREELAERAPGGIDWNRALDPARAVGDAPALVDRLIAAARRRR